jgi:hypothetical protein
LALSVSGSSPCFLDHDTVTAGQSTAIKAPR